jgi:hypothetical protein
MIPAGIADPFPRIANVLACGFQGVNALPLLFILPIHVNFNFP